MNSVLFPFALFSLEDSEEATPTAAKMQNVRNLEDAKCEMGNNRLAFTRTPGFSRARPFFSFLTSIFFRQSFFPSIFFPFTLVSSFARR